MMCGGTGSTQDATDEIQNMIDGLRNNVEAKAGKSFPQYKAVSYKSQVVAGTNFFVKVQVGDAEYVHIRVFRPLPHVGEGPGLHGLQLGKAKEDEVEYFEEK